MLQAILILIALTNGSDEINMRKSNGQSSRCPMIVSYPILKVGDIQFFILGMSAVIRSSHWQQNAIFASCFRQRQHDWDTTSFTSVVWIYTMNWKQKFRLQISGFFYTFPKLFRELPLLLEIHMQTVCRKIFRLHLRRHRQLAPKMFSTGATFCKWHANRLL